MHRPRIIPVLLLKDLALVKSISFKDHRYIGDPIHAVHIFNDLLADELVFLDIEASKQGRSIDTEFVRKIGEEADMPFAVGVVLNSIAVEEPEFVRRAADEFGSSTIVVCMDVKSKWLSGLRTWIHGGAKATKYDPVSFAEQMQQLGAGEIIVQSIDRDGSMQGYDIQLIRSISERVTIPVVALGGAGSLAHMKEAYDTGYANGLAAGSMFVYQSARRGVLINYPEERFTIDN
jgi:cyclase